MGVKPRLTLLDEARGVCLIWMVLSHALGQAGIPLDHPLRFFSSRGWPTVFFVMVTGVTVAYLYSTGKDQTPVNRLYRRGLEVAAIAIISNMLSLIARNLIEGTLDGPRLVSVLTLRAPWTISSALVPTAILLVLGPTILRALKCSSVAVGLLVATVLIAALNVFIETAPAAWRVDPSFRALFLAGPNQIPESYFAFPVAGMAALGLWALTLGAAVPPSKGLWGLVAAGTAGITVVSLVASGVGWIDVLLMPARFTIFMMIVKLAQYISWGQSIRDWVMLLGRSSLLVFLLHRILIQLTARSLRGIMPSVPLYVVIAVVTLVGCTLAVHLREASGETHRSLRRLGL